jgi:hypothetical protein
VHFQFPAEIRPVYLRLKEKPQGEAHLRQAVNYNDKSRSLQSTFWKRAQHMIYEYSDGFHLYVPPFGQE